MGNLDEATNHYFMHILSKAVLFCGSFLLVMLHVGVCCNVVSDLVALWSPTGKGLTSWL